MYRKELEDLSCTFTSPLDSMCKSNLYLAHRTVVLESESKKEMIFHLETGVLQDFYKHNATLSSGRDPC